MSFWKQSRGNTSEAHLVEGAAPARLKYQFAPTYSELVQLRSYSENFNYQAVARRWDILRREILNLFFKETKACYSALKRNSKRALNTNLNTLSGAETYYLFSKPLMETLNRPFGLVIQKKVSMGIDIWAALDSEAKSDGISIHTLIRKILISYVDAYPRCGHALELLSRPAPSVPPPANYIDPVLTVDQIKEVMFDLQ